jgi:hypothetical protein
MFGVAPKVEETSEEALPKRPAAHHQAFPKACARMTLLLAPTSTQETRTLISSSVRFDNRATLYRHKRVKRKYAGFYQLPAYTAITLRES